MPNYQKGKIYKIWYDDDVYIGSTTVSLSRRFSGHKYNQDTTVKQIFDKHGMDKCKIELLESYPCETSLELRRKEGEWIMKLKCVNRCVAGRTNSECGKAWYQSHKEERKMYRDEHKEEKKEYHKAYREANREKIVAYLREYNKKKREER